MDESQIGYKTPVQSYETSTADSENYLNGDWSPSESPAKKQRPITHSPCSGAYDDNNMDAGSGHVGGNDDGDRSSNQNWIAQISFIFSIICLLAFICIWKFPLVLVAYMPFLGGHTAVGQTLLAVSSLSFVFGIGVLVGNPDKKEQVIQDDLAKDKPYSSEFFQPAVDLQDIFSTEASDMSHSDQQVTADKHIL
ncbi:hypothetical protein N9Y17_04535 [Gammaproteobacteria bacterium]|nr:hypothetical protein [Gammaproteobacteria bacterium]